MAKRKAQAALEFISTYGWALLIIIVMIGAIAYFGILNPSKFLPDRCSTSPEFNCVDHQISSTSKLVSMQFSQSIGKTIYFDTFACSYMGGPTPVAPTAVRVYDLTTDPTKTAPLAAGTSWSPTHKVEVQCDYTNKAFIDANKGQKIKVAYTLTYKTSSTGFVQRVDGEVFSTVQ